MDMDTTFADGMYELVDCYDGFIMDQWGVLHDGQKLYPGVVDVLAHLKARKKQVIVLSNSAKRSDYNGMRLKRLGLKSGVFKTVLSAGEVTWQGLKYQKEAPFKGLGKDCYLVTRDDERSLLDGLDLNVVDEVEKAGFILVTSVEAPEKSLADYEPMLKKGVSKRLPLICANPDLITIFGHEHHMGPGALAQRYLELGGAAHFIGKPHKPIFRHAISMFDGLIPSRIVVIGDSLHHDIAGAQGVNLDGAFITSGVHAKSFREDMAPGRRRKAMEMLVQQYGVRPKWALESLIWQSRDAALRDRERALAKD